jgi:hypothetical protein
MNQIKSNRHSQAVSEVEKLDANQVGKMKEFIDPKDADQYHVALVKIFDRPGQPTNDVKIVVQHFNAPGFKKIESNFMYHGYQKIIVLHDPTQPIEGMAVSTTINTGSNDQSAPAKTEAEIEAMIEKRAQEKANQMIADKKANETDTTDTDEEGEKEVEQDKHALSPFHFGETVNEMKAFAEKHKIELSGLKKSAEIKAVLITWYNENREAIENGTYQIQE